MAIRGIRSNTWRRPRSPYFGGRNQRGIELRNRQAALGILPSAQNVQHVQNVQTMDVSRNPYAPRLAPQRPLAPPPLERPIPAIPPPGQGVVRPEWRTERARLAEIAVPYSQEELNKSGLSINDYLSQLERRRAEAVIGPEQPPLSSAESAQIEQRYSGEFALINDFYKRGYAQPAIAALSELEKKDPRIARHPTALFIRGQEKFGALPLSEQDRWEQRKRYAKEIALQAKELERQGKRQEARESLSVLVDSSPIFDAPDLNKPEEVRTAEILANHPVASPLYKSITKLLEEMQKPDAPLEVMWKRYEALEKRYMGIKLDIYKQEQARTAEATDRQRIDNLADTLSKLPEAEQQQRRSLLDTETLAKLNQAYPGGLPAAKPIVATAQARSQFARVADDYLAEQGEYSEKNKSKDELAEMKAAFSPELLEDNREKFVADNSKTAQANGLDDDDLRIIWEQRLRAITGGKVAAPPRKPTAGQPTSNLDSRINRLRSAGVPEEEIQQALA